jgi:hypothetical protein
MSGDVVTYEQFAAAIKELRETIDKRADRIEAVIHAHSQDDAAQFKSISERVLTIEIQREEEKNAVMKRSTWIGMLAAAAITGIWKVLDHLWK